MTFRTPEEVFEGANNIPYGLNAGLLTDTRVNCLFLPKRKSLPVRGPFR